MESFVTDILTLKHEKKTWYPASIQSFDNHLSFLISVNDFFDASQAYPIKKNISYSLQYIEFLNRVLKDISLSTVLLTQNIKSFVVHGAAVLEAIFNFLVVSKGYGNKVTWQKVNTHGSPEYSLNGIKYKNETNIMTKLEEPVKAQMTFDQLAKKVESKKLLGGSFASYSKIKPIRQLRNKIHIHDSDHLTDTDWNNFNDSEFKLVSNVLYQVLTSEVFVGSNHFERFAYLDTAISKSKRARKSWLRFASLHNFSQPLLSLLFGR
jgi:hypothetical protein